MPTNILWTPPDWAHMEKSDAQGRYYRSPRSILEAHEGRRVRDVNEYMQWINAVPYIYTSTTNTTGGGVYFDGWAAA